MKLSLKFAALAALVTLAGFGPAHAQATSTPQAQLIAGSREVPRQDIGPLIDVVFNTCIDQITTLSHARRALMDAGLRFEASAGQLRFFSADGRRLMVGVSNRRNSQRCFVGLNKMREQESMETAQQLITARFGNNATRITREIDDIYAAWEVEVDGHALGIAVMDYFEPVFWHRSAPIVVLLLD